jgi:hypothetical protein
VTTGDSERPWLVTADYFDDGEVVADLSGSRGSKVVRRTAVPVHELRDPNTGVTLV